MSGERRRTRRPEGPRRPQESWFGAVGVNADTELGDDALLDEDDSRYSGGWRHHGPAQADSRFLSRQARRLVTAGPNAFQRIHHAFLTARAAIGFALILALVLTGAFGQPPRLVVAVISLAYAVLAFSTWLLPRFRRDDDPNGNVQRLGKSQWLATIGADICCFAALHAASASASFNYVALLVLPALMAGVLTPRLLALAAAAAIALALLGAAWLGISLGGDAAALMTQAGLAGSGMFVITILAGELAGRLAREELTAKGSLELARQQAQLNRLVIEEMQDGVLVVDRRGRVRTANPAARSLLASNGMAPAAPFKLRGVPEWDALVHTVDRALVEGFWPEAGRDVLLAFDGGMSRTLRVRIRFTRRTGDARSEEFCVLLLEDVRSMQARTRQEKLAAMGRVSAGIAHEIRNPLAAIAQANALLAEDATTPGQRQLTQMVSDNVDRLKRIVDDVMEVAPGVAQEAGVIDVSALVAAVCSEWARTGNVPVDDRSVLKVSLPLDPLGAAFDAEHLRRVLVNLLDNGFRHATQSAGSVHVHLGSGGQGKVRLTVSSDGAPIPPDVERHLFEPFFSTRSRGTGLGLYICRELCERYGASIDFRLRPPSDKNRNEFYVLMPQQPLDAAEKRLHLSM